MALHSMTIALLIVAALCTSVVLTKEYGTKEYGGDGQTMDCFTYVNITSTSALCNDRPDVVCSGGCTGYTTASKCSTSQTFGDQSGPLTTEKCTVSFGPTSATATICITEKRSFTCYGQVTGKAKCMGCKSSKNPATGDSSSNHTTSPTGKNSTTTAGKNSTSTAGSTSGGASGNTSGNTTVDTSGGTANKTAGDAGTTPPPSSTGTDSSKTPSAGTALGLNGVSLALATFLSFMFA